MASKTRSLIESEWDSIRDKKQWGSLSSLATKSSQQLPNTSLENLIAGEAALMNKNWDEAANQFRKASALEPSSEEPDFFLMRVEFERQRFAESLRHFDSMRVKVDALGPKFFQSGIRRLRSFAESITIAVACHETSGRSDLAVQSIESHLRWLSIHQSQIWGVLTPEIQRAIYEAVGKAVAWHRANSDSMKTVQAMRFYHYLSIPMIPETTQRHLFECAQLLLHCVSDSVYVPPFSDLPARPGEEDSARFVPSTPVEDALLLLLLCENSMASKPPTSDPKFLKAVVSSLTLALARHSGGGDGEGGDQQHRDRIVEVYERALSWLPSDSDLWTQFVLSLVAAHQHARAMVVLEDRILVQPEQALFPLLASSICLNHSGETQRAVEFAEKAVTIGDPSYSFQAHHALGLACGKRALEVESREERTRLQTKSFEALSKAVELDPDSDTARAHLAWACAELRKIDDAFAHVSTCLSLNRLSLDGWLLLALLFTCKKQNKKALKTCHAALSEYPGNLQLLLVRAKIEQSLGLLSSLQKTNEELLAQLNVLFPTSLNSADGSSPGAARPKLGEGDEDDEEDPEDIEVIEDDGQAPLVPSLSNQPQNQSFTRHLAFLIFSHLLDCRREFFDRTHSGSTPSSLPQMEGSGGVVPSKQVKVAEMSKFVGECNKILKRAKGIWTNLADFHVESGKILEHQGKRSEAVAEYEIALCLAPRHSEALLRLGSIFRSQGKNVQARSYLGDAVRVDPCLEKAWYELGSTLKEFGELTEAADCLIAALKLEESSPITAFHQVVKILL